MLAAMSSSSRPGGWANRDFHDEVPRARGLLQRGTTAGIVTALTVVVMLLAVNHESGDCRDLCRDGNGIQPRQDGYAWTAYQDSWQWQAQWLLGVGSLGLALAALATTSRHAWRRWTPWLELAAVACAVGWALWTVLQPATPPI